MKSGQQRAQMLNLRVAKRAQLVLHGVALGERTSANAFTWVGAS